ncbi:hypothetical protein DAPPUDRAFT_309088 [Daphnia pulex]|uniref:F-box domain-containing protein n=1 Tax=Daphnia pulex TaxID=6669 RepID=E9G3P7_DAPPU|nr:hypothetical protein DAPPUDRAFT_309088 [Daphnia pulex]|eukprot:EFX85944.1 hypothetical protein DAPPUDRAFT_309088 [Daphnia pulex]
MPQLIGVKSLSQTCLDFVINNMAVLCEKPTSNIPTTISNQSNHSPFHQLPSKFFEEIISALQTKRCLTQFLGLLVAPQLETLDLRYLSEEDNCIYFKNGRGIPQCRWSSLSNDFLNSVIPMFVKLQVLNISYSAAGDSSLEVIGTYCTDLRELEVIYCKNITDIGVKGLCVSSTTHNLGREGNKLGLHKSLLKLVSYGTEITNAGIQLGLETFRSLKVWDMATVQILAEIHKEDFLNRPSEIPKYSLMNLKIASLRTFEDVVYIPKSFGLVLSLCPFVIDVEINIVPINITDSDFLSLLSLEKLRKLKLVGDYENSSVTFHGGVTPILKAFGNSSLKALSLSYLPDVNIQVIAQLCPNLHSLDLFDNLSYSNKKLNEEWFKIEPQVLKQLEKLNLASDEEPRRSITIPRNHFILLLSGPSLVEIYIASFCSLNDGVLQEVVRVQNFDRLESLEVKRCHNVTEKGIDIFMNAQNPLKKIVLHWCHKLTKKNFEHWEKQAKMNNWQILIDFESDDDEEDYYEDYY